MFMPTDLESLFLGMVDIEPYIDRVVVRDEFGNLILQVLLGLKTQWAVPRIAHGGIPHKD